MAVMNRLKQIWKTKDLRNSILYVLLMLVVYRVVTHIPLPGMDVGAMRDFVNGNQLLGFIDLFSGGGIRNFSIAAMGVAPYITASIIIQLLTMVIPSLEELSKEGEQGQAKINQYTRFLTVPISVLQAVSLMALLKNAATGVFSGMTSFDYVLAVTTLTAGTVFLMWIGDLITEKKIGNGVSVLIFAAIVAQLPVTLQQAYLAYDPSQLPGLIGFGIIALLTVVSVVYMTEGQRKIPVSYARLRGAGTGVASHLPIKVNQAGVIPIIFAISIVLFPPVIAQLFLNAESEILRNIAEFTIFFFQNQLYYGIVYFLLVIGFTYFYTGIIFQPEKVADNLQKQGGFIPGIRPGKPTEKYVSYVSNRVILAGALFLGIIAVLPLLVEQATGLVNLALGGTSLLIVVSVVLEIVRQIDSQLVMRDYEHL